MNPHLGKPKHVSFSSLFLDPNNPRLGMDKPGYGDPQEIFGDECQKEIEEKIPGVYKTLDGLKTAILQQGWTPIDAILVWEHPAAKGHFIVVEGNTRVAALRTIRADLEKSKKTLERLKKGKAQKSLIEETEREIKRSQDIVDDTESILVTPLTVPTAEALRSELPRILSVRHIAHPRQWGPYAQSLYIVEQYEELFHAKHGPDKDVFVDEDLVEKVANMFSQKVPETRRNIQSASAFRRFRQKYAPTVEALGEDEGLRDEDHYFFVQILENKYAKEEFKFGDDQLNLSQEMEEVLFKWAFAKPRSGQNENVLYKAENFREWRKMAKDMPELATQLDVSMPDNAPNFHELESSFHASKAQKAPTRVIEKLLKQLQDLPAEHLTLEQSHLKPLLEQVAKTCNDYLKMLTAVGDL